MSEQTEVHGDNFGNKGSQSVAKDQGTIVYKGVSLKKYTQVVIERERAIMDAERRAEHLKELQKWCSEIREGEPVDPAAYAQLKILLSRTKI
jgi:hypothetical protein